MRLLVCGGAGYIGSHMCKMLAEHHHEVSVLDNFSTGHREAVQWGTLYEGGLDNEAFLEHVFSSVKPEAVLHFAARSLVGESGLIPRDYYWNNVVATLRLLDHVRREPGCTFIFSSTAAVFGIPQADTVAEDHVRNPINAYGRTKLAIEFVLADFARAYGVSSASYRYFNAAGAEPSGVIGESHFPETHLIPNILESLLGRSNGLKVYGSDYPTPDGTCIRDYVHIEDLCRAHLAGLDYLQRSPGAHFFNLGNGGGFSVKQVIEAAQDVAGRPVQYEFAERRAGDPPRLVANAAFAKRQLGWEPIYKDIASIIATAWNWHSNRRF